LIHLDIVQRMPRLQPFRFLLGIIVEGNSAHSQPLNILAAGITNLTGDLNGDAASEPDATRPLLPRGAWATRGILGYVDTVSSLLLRRVVVKS